MAATALAEMVQQVAAIVFAVTIIGGSAVAGSKLKATRWLVRTLVGAPFMGWIDKQIQRHTDPITRQLEPNGGKSLYDRVGKTETTLQDFLTELRPMVKTIATLAGPPRRTARTRKGDK